MRTTDTVLEPIKFVFQDCSQPVNHSSPIPRTTRWTAWAVPTELCAVIAVASLVIEDIQGLRSAERRRELRQELLRVAGADAFQGWADYLHG